MRRSVAAVAGLVVAGAAGFTYANYYRDIQAAFERIAAGGRVIDTSCGRIEYAIAGEGAPVLAVHGAGGGYDQGLDFAGGLAAAGFRVIAMSRFGYLRTPLPTNSSAAAQADAHACLLDALGISRAAVVGVSAGAPSSLQFALRHPDRASALILVVPALYVPRDQSEPSLRTPPGTDFLFETALKSDFAFWAALKLARRTMIRAILATPPERVQEASADEQARVDKLLAHILPVTPRILGLLNDAAVTSSLERYELERVTVPTLAVSVADDLFGTFDAARYTVEHIRGARFKGYDRGGHVLAGHYDELMSEMAAFLRDL